MSDELIGSVIDRRYRVDRRIGEGGMGAVFQGEHVTVGNKVAIKVLHAEYCKDQEIVRRLAQEARVTGTLGHKNIVQVFDFSQMPDGTHYLVMEFLEGETLADYLARENPVPPRFILPIALQVLEALAAAHARGIIHRDLKPENVFLTASSDPAAHVKVLDFGISKVRTGGDDLHLTKTGTVLGTPYFMSPEQASGKKDIDTRTDIYALGVILYQAITGSYPFTGDTYNELIINIFSTDPKPPREMRAEIPAAVEALILKAMAKQREDRFPDARSFAEAVNALLADPTLKDVFGGMSRSALMRSAQRVALASVPPPAQPASPRTPSGTVREALDESAATPPRRRGALWAGIGAAVAAAAVGAFLLLRGGPETSREDAATAARSDAGVVAAASPADVAPPAEAVPDSVPADPDGPAGETVAATADAASPQADVVVIKLSAAPAEARIQVDDVEVGNPFEARRRRGDPDVKVEVSARGYDSQVQFVQLDADREITVTLERTRPSAPRRDAGTTAPPPPPPSPPPPPTPDAGPRPPGIDTQNPFTGGRHDGGAPAPIDRSRPFG